MKTVKLLAAGQASHALTWMLMFSPGVPVQSQNPKTITKENSGHHATHLHNQKTLKKADSRQESTVILPTQLFRYLPKSFTIQDHVLVASGSDLNTIVKL